MLCLSTFVVLVKVCGKKKEIGHAGLTTSSACSGQRLGKCGAWTSSSPPTRSARSASWGPAAPLSPSSLGLRPVALPQNAPDVVIIAFAEWRGLHALMANLQQAVLGRSLSAAPRRGPRHAPRTRRCLHVQQACSTLPAGQVLARRRPTGLLRPPAHQRRVCPG